MDKRHLLRAAPPDGRSKMIQVYVTSQQYEDLYFFAFEHDLSRSDALRQLIQEIRKGEIKMKNQKTVDSTSDERTANNAVRHQYRVLTDDEKHAVQNLKDRGAEFIQRVDSIGTGREFAIAKTKMEEAVMWAVKGITA